MDKCNNLLYIAYIYTDNIYNIKMRFVHCQIIISYLLFETLSYYLIKQILTM